MLGQYENTIKQIYQIGLMAVISDSIKYTGLIQQQDKVVVRTSRNISLFVVVVLAM